VVEELPGFGEIGDCRSESDLPQQARDYLNFIADFIEVPVRLVGVGPSRDQVIWMDGGAPGFTRAGAAVA
jgi:adenylosuccinate synthase